MCIADTGVTDRESGDGETPRRDVDRRETGWRESVRENQRA